MGKHWRTAHQDSVAEHQHLKQNDEPALGDEGVQEAVVAQRRTFVHFDEPDFNVRRQLPEVLPVRNEIGTPA